MEREFQISVASDANMKQIYKKYGLALYLLTEPERLITKFKQVKDGEKYGIFCRYEEEYY